MWDATPEITRAVTRRQARVSLELVLAPGENRVAVQARNRHGPSEPEIRLVTRDATGGPGLKRPDLCLLAIGVSEYANPQYNLGYAHADAEAMTRVLAAQEGRFYGQVRTRLLTDREADREGVIEGLEWLQRAGTQNDLAVIFIAGHGIKERGQYYFLGHDADPNRARVTGVKWREFIETMEQLPGIRWLLADTCRAGAITGKRGQTSQGMTRDAADVTDALRELEEVEGGVVVMSAATGREVSVESRDWRHGAFTKAIIEGLEEGRAPHAGDGIIRIRELDAYVTGRVRALTDGEQHPMTEVPRMMTNFPVAVCEV
ncbi:MAG: Caspase domain-containing protein [Candidatus Kentron sp. G]|nr:MAG: Caspase domain-containing protein [Candidatus Kentron sp. G]VFN03939.1 MAG: Caspase domain-containing protein [Candidatus Kentron sp. G]VFN05979.1 MAG: Caspase domain-containing protein [Candidatus Kentron sp. G]